MKLWSNRFKPHTPLLDVMKIQEAERQWRETEQILKQECPALYRQLLANIKRREETT